VVVSQCIAVINAGSSSIKFALYDAASEEICLFRGQIDAIGIAPRLRVVDANGVVVEERAFASKGFDHDAAMREILSVGAKLLRGAPVAGFGHRVVHGGLRTIAPCE
jgi:acetate kinase